MVIFLWYVQYGQYFLNSDQKGLIIMTQNIDDYTVSENEWSNIAGYFLGKIKEYCAKNSIDKEDFATKLGINSRALARLYSKQALKSERRNNRLLSSLEFFKFMADALEMDVIRFFTEINIFSRTNHVDYKELENLEDKLSTNILDKEMIGLIKGKIDKDSLKKYILLGLATSLIKKSSLNIIISVIENDNFESISKEEKEMVLNKIRTI